MSRHVTIPLAFLLMASSFALAAADISLGSGIIVEPAQSAALPITLARPAGDGGVYVDLTSSDSTVLTIRPSTVLIPAGSTVPYRLPQVTGGNFGSATVTASAIGLSGDNRIVRVAATLFGPASAALQTGTTQSTTLTLSSPAPSPLTITLTSSNPAVASVPSSIYIPANVSQASVPVTGNGPGSAIIHASGPAFGADYILNVSVTSPGMIILPATVVVVNDGQSATFPVKLSTPAPGPGVVVALDTSDPGRVTIAPASVFIPGGATVPATQPQVSGVNIGGAVITASAPGYIQATQSVAVPATVTISPSSLSLTRTSQGQLQLALSASAPWGIGLTVQLSSSDPSVASVDPSINFYPDGSAFTTVVIIVTPHGQGTATISAGAPPFIPLAYATVTVLGAAGPAASVDVNAGSPQSALINTGFASPLSALVTDSGGNPVPGTTVTFTAPSSGPGAVFPAGNTATTNTAGIATSSAFTANGTAGVYAILASVSGVASPAVFRITNTSSVLGNIVLAANVSTGPSQSVAFPVSLSVPAPPSGLNVALSSSDPSKVTISPASIFVAGGATIPVVQPQVSGIAFGSATISAAAPGYTSASQLVQVTGALSFSPGTLAIRGKISQSLALTLSSPAPAGGFSVALSSDNPGVATVPPTVQFTAGSNTASVLITATGYGAANVTASSSITQLTGATASITVTPAYDITVGAGISVEPGQSVSVPVSLAAPAAPGGVYVTLTSSNPSVLDIFPSAVYIPEGATVPTRLPQVNAFQFGSATVSASAFGLTGDSETVLVASSLFGPANITVDRGATQNVVFTISNPAASPLTVALSSDNPSIAAVPANVTIYTGGTVAYVPVTGIGAGSTAIHLGGASFGGNTTLNVNVVAPGAIILPANVIANQSGPVPFPVTLGSPAPVSGLTISLASSDPARVAVSPSVVFISGGAVSPATQPQVNGLNIGASTVTATAPGYLSASSVVSVPATVTFSPANLTVSRSGQGQLQLALSASAPWGIGVTVNLTSSDPTVASVPPTANFYPDGSAFTTIVVAVTPGVAGTTVIQASAPPFIPVAVATVTVQ